MGIDLKSNRSFLIKTFLPFVIIIFALILIMSVCYIIDLESMKGSMIILVVFIGLELIMLSIIFVAKFYKGKSYKFLQDKVLVFNKGKLINEISLNEIESMHYYKFKFRYIITIFAGALNEGSCWRLYLKNKNNKKINLAFFSLKDIEKLQKFYPNLILIH